MNKSNSNTHALLVEIMVAVLFFALCTAGLLEAFAAVHRQSERSANTTSALSEARSVLEQLNAASEAESVLTANGFTQVDDSWISERGGWSLTVTLTSENTGAGTLTSSELRAADQGGELFTLHGAHYEPQEVE